MTIPQLSSRVEDLMTAPVVGVAPAMSVRQAVELMREHRISHLPVIGEAGPVGIVCSCDLADAPLNADVSSVMRQPALAIESAESAGDAASLMRDAGVGSLLVTTQGKLSGMVTPSDFERLGLAELAFGDRRCARCGSFVHVHRDTANLWWCSDCRARLGPPNGDELGVAD